MVSILDLSLNLMWKSGWSICGLQKGRMYGFGLSAIAKSSTPTPSSFHFHSIVHSSLPMMIMDEVERIMKENEERVRGRVLERMMSIFKS